MQLRRIGHLAEIRDDESVAGVIQSFRKRSEVDLFRNFDLSGHATGNVDPEVAGVPDPECERSKHL